MINGPMEPAANYRQVANQLRQIYVALLEEDFTETEALIIIGQVISASI